jgi:hypothetical protein
VTQNNTQRIPPGTKQNPSITPAHSTAATERTLADMQCEFGWPCWQDGSLLFARRPHTTGDYDAQGDDPDDLREAIPLALQHPTPPAPRPAGEGNVR